MKDIRYYYDASGRPVAIRAFTRTSSTANFTDTIYYLQTNLQGDVVGIYNASGTKIYEYAYDAWGNIIKSSQVATGGNAAHAVNPFRYRGYYYDTETGFYYLQSRYYNPEWGRFLNADGYVNANGDIIGYNMYAYCSNNPIMGTDPSGEGWLGALVGGACGAVVGGVFGFLSAATSGSNLAAGFTTGLVNGAICGAVGGSIAEDIATFGLSSIGTATMVAAAAICFSSGVLTDVWAQAWNSTPIDKLKGTTAVRSGFPNIVITGLSLTPAGLGALGTAGDIVMNTVFNLFASTGQWIHNTIKDSMDQSE